MKVISFCLWGNKPMYDIGAIKNAELARQIYPDWQAWFYIPRGYNENIVSELTKRDAKIIERPRIDNCLAMKWRFLPAFDKNIDIFICRDCDARLTIREYNAVLQFEKSAFHYMHCIKDHEAHQGFIIMGGTCGFKTKLLYREFKNNYDYFYSNGYKIQWPEYSIYGNGNYLGADQIFLQYFVYPKMKNHILFHCDLPNRGTPLEKLEDKTTFIGNKFDENDNPQFIRGY